MDVKLCIVATLLPVLSAMPAPVGVAAQDAPLFRTSAERVTVAVVARDRNGRPLTGLSASDFQIFDNAEPREILDFRSDESPVSVALLLDTSGSMHIDPKERLTSEAGHFLLASLNEGVDEAALFVFDKMVSVAAPFTSDFGAIRSALGRVRPYGSTSLYDAIAATSQELARRPGRRALVVVTDGVDTSSEKTAPEVSAIASTIDMPVYVVAVGTSTDFSGEPAGKAVDASANLRDLARWSGGAFYHSGNSGEGSVAARQIVADLRHQYLIAFEPGRAAGWHRIEVRARQRQTLQARTGYWVGPSSVEP